MLEKLKSWAEGIKGIALYYLLPLFGALTYIFLLREKNKALEDNVAKEKANAALAVEISKKDEAVSEATTATGDYESIRDKYLKAHSDNGGRGDV